MSRRQSVGAGALTGRGWFLCGGKNVPPPRVAMEERGRDRSLARGGSDLFHRLGLRPFGALGDLKLNCVALIERLKAGVFNR